MYPVSNFSAILRYPSMKQKWMERRKGMELRFGVVFIVGIDLF